MKSFAGFTAFVAIASFGLQSSVEANCIAPYVPYGPGTVVLEADLELPLDVTRIVSLAVDAVIAELLPLIIASWPILLPIIQYLLRILVI